MEIALGIESITDEGVSRLTVGGIDEDRVIVAEISLERRWNVLSVGGGLMVFA